MEGGGDGGRGSRTLTYESPSRAAALRAFFEVSYCAATRKTPAASSLFQNMMYVAPEERASSISSLGIVCAHEQRTHGTVARRHSGARAG